MVNYAGIHLSMFRNDNNTYCYGLLVVKSCHDEEYDSVAVIIALRYAP